MDREPANKSMGCFAIYKEAYKLTVENEKIFSEIALTILLPLAFSYLSEIRILTYSREETPGWLDYGLTIAQWLHLFSLLIYALLSTSSIVHPVARFYNSKDINYEKVTLKLWGKLIVTFLWCFLLLAVYASLALALGFSLLLFPADEQRITALILIICLAIPFFNNLTYVMVVCNTATVVTVLENDCYGREALAKSMKLINGKERVSRAVFGVLGITFTGISFTYYQFVNGNNMGMLGKLVVGIGFHIMAAIWVHFLLVVHTVLYFVCKSVHNDDISTVGTHLEMPVIHLGREIQFERVPAV